MQLNDLLQSHHLRTIISRFEARYLAEPMSGCWLWEDTVNANEYGWIYVVSRAQLAHRVSWVLHRGPIPPGTKNGTTCVLHRCDNPTCVNPDHLFLGDMASNNADKMQKGRHKTGRGGTHWNVKLTEAEVIKIYTSSIDEEYLATCYGVHVYSIRNIKKRATWAYMNLHIASDGSAKHVYDTPIKYRRPPTA